MRNNIYWNVRNIYIYQIQHWASVLWKICLSLCEKSNIKLWRKKFFFQTTNAILQHEANALSVMHLWTLSPSFPECTITICIRLIISGMQKDISRAGVGLYLMKSKSSFKLKRRQLRNWSYTWPGVIFVANYSNYFHQGKIPHFIEHFLIFFGN